MDRSENTALIIAVLLMAVFFGALIYSATGLKISLPTCVTDVAPFKQGKVIDKGNNHYEVHIVAKMWAFDPPEIRLPPGADVDLYLSALDVVHGLYIEHTDVNLMAVPGAVNATRVHFGHEGVYDMICHEYCGAGHQNMMGKIIIAKGAVPVVAPPPGPALAGAAQSGEELFQSKGCVACHSTDGSPRVGPSLKGVYGHETDLVDGSKVLADDAYLEESIRHPNAQLDKGYQPIMPEVPLTDAEVQDLVAYIKSLS